MRSDVFGTTVALFVVILWSTEPSSGFSKSYDKVSVGLLLGDKTLHNSAAQYILAAKWASEVINNQSVTQGVRIATEVFDACGQADRDVFFAIKTALEPRGNLPLLGLIAMGDPEVVGETLASLQAFNIPLILASPKLADSVIKRGNVLTIAPDMSGLVMPVLAVARQLGINRISLITYCKHSIQRFQHAAKEMNIKNGRLLDLTKHSKATGDVVKKFLETSESNETIALILDPEDIYTIAECLRGYKLYNGILLTGTIGLDKNSLKLWKNMFIGGYLVEPHMPELPDFRNYFISKLHSAGAHNDTVLQKYVEEGYRCKWKKDMDPQSPAQSCEILTEEQLTSGLRILPEVTFIVKAVSAFSAAVFLVQAEQCQGQNLTECSRISNINLQQKILEMLSQLSFTSEATSLHVTHEGQLISNKYVIYNIRGTGDVTGVGWYSDEQGLVLDYGTGQTTRDGPKVLLNDKWALGFGVETTATGIRFENAAAKGSQGHVVEAGTGVNVRRVTPESSFTRPWATMMAAVAAIGTCVTMFMLVYVLIKICDGTLSGNQSLGIVLLLGIMTLYASIILFLLPASEVRCTLRVFLYPIAMSVCYGILIIKAMQLRSLVLLGLGGTVSYINQYIVLFFIVLVQVVISAQWFIANKPHHRLDTQGFPYCYMPRRDFLLLHLYIAVLVIIAFLYGLTVLKIRRNYKEGHWITLAAFLTMPVLAIWGLAHSFVPEHYDDPSVCMALVVLASVLVLAVFIPKMNTISKQSSHFKHKKMQFADSVTTFTDLHHSSLTGTGNKMMRPPAHSDNITKNPIYEVTPDHINN